MVLDWAIGNETCEVAHNKANYICGANTACIDLNGPGYRCKCKEGYLGNPYLKDGCQDIDECKGINNCTEKQTCANKPGNYECSCIKGYHLESAVCVSNQSSLAIHLAVGMFNMLSDPGHEVKNEAATMLSNFLQETKISQISEFIQLGKEELVPYSAKIVGVILDSISDNDYAIRKVANQTNKMFRKILKSSNAEQDVVRAIFSVVARNLSSECTEIRIQSLKWIATLSKNFAEILSSQDDLLDKLLKMLLDPSTEAVRLVHRVHARMAEDVQIKKKGGIKLTCNLIDNRANDTIQKSKSTLNVKQMEGSYRNTISFLSHGKPVTMFS
nr:protein vac14 like [Quercus suber]